MITWPAIIKHAEDAELIYVRDQSQWDHDAELHSFEYTESDCLIDSAGTIFTLSKRSNQLVIPVSNGHSMALDKILGLIKAHAAQTGSCCVAKLYAPTIREAFKIVASLHEV